MSDYNFINRDWAMERAASAWTDPRVSHLAMDPLLCEVFAEILDQVRNQRKPVDLAGQWRWISPENYEAAHPYPRQVHDPVAALGAMGNAIDQDPNVYRAYLDGRERADEIAATQLAAFSLIGGGYLSPAEAMAAQANPPPAVLPPPEPAFTDTFVHPFDAIPPVAGYSSEDDTPF